MTHTTLVWLRDDLRLDDNPALADAASGDGATVPLFVLDRADIRPWSPGAASKAWLHHSLIEMGAALGERGSRLVLRGGEPRAVVPAFAAECGATAVVWNRRYDPHGAALDAEVEAALRERGIEVRTHAGALLIEPGAIRTGKGEPYRVFTPFWKAFLALPEPPAPRRLAGPLSAPASWPRADALGALGLLPDHPWTGTLLQACRPGRNAGLDALASFVDEALADYAVQRDQPGAAGVSRLSAHLHFGEVSPREVWHAVRTAGRPAGDPFARQLVWREFAHHLLAHYPETAEAPMDPRFTRFPWTRDQQALTAWQRGQTGYPLVDAGMRELWRTGWMHNRVRMVTASFLVKHLLVHWLEGARWFWDTLVDADLANNTMGWQWTAGCGADAAPFFRIFNPVAQGERFDPAGAYVARWVPELARIPRKWIHRPWQAPADVLTDAGVALGKSYPRPIVDHTSARARALAALDTIKRSG